MNISQKMYIEATGELPQDDDLERSNCPKAGQVGHEMCGWNYAANLPCFMRRPQKPEDRLPNAKQS